MFSYLSGSRSTATFVARNHIRTNLGEPMVPGDAERETPLRSAQPALIPWLNYSHSMFYGYHCAGFPQDCQWYPLSPETKLSSHQTSPGFCWQIQPLPIMQHLNNHWSWKRTTAIGTIDASIQSHQSGEPDKTSVSTNTTRATIANSTKKYSEPQ